MNPAPQLTDDQRRAVEEFRERHRTAVLALVFTDIEGSTALKNDMGELPASALIERHNRLIREEFASFTEAQEISTAGDSFFLVFAKPSDAVRFALLSQKRLRELAAQEWPEFRVRMGIHLGEVAVEEETEGGPARDVLGMQVDLAARVAGLAAGGQILMTRGVFDNARQILKGEFLPGIEALSWFSHGPYLVKGLDEPLAICEVGETGKAKLSPPTDSYRGRRATVPGVEPVLGWRPAVEQVIPGTEWVIEKNLGEGGFGEVWLACNRRTKDHRVFKFCFSGDRLRNLKREMTLFRVLKEVLGERPDIARLYDVQFEEAPYYLELEYTSGGDLAGWIESRGGFGNVPQELRLEIVAQIATALAAAHSVGVIHEDVKPSNILVEERKDGSIQVRLTDFGIGQVTDRAVIERAGVTATGLTEIVSPSAPLSMRTGTRLYMAPEMIAGRPRSTKSDIYSLGILLYQLIIGDLTQPMTTDWERHVDDPLLRDDLRGCLAGDPADRYAGAEDLAQRLRSIDERRVALAERQAAQRAHARRRRLAAVFASATSLLLVLAAVLAYGLHRERIAYRKMEREYYYATIAKADKEYEDAHPDTVRELLVLCPERYRNWEWGRLQYLVNLDRMTLKGHTSWVRSVAFSPDGKLVASASQDGTARIWNLDAGGDALTLRGHSDTVWSVAFSPDGTRVATGSSDKTARIWDVKSGKPLLTIRGYIPILNPSGHSDTVRAVAFSPDAKYFATAGDDKTAKLWDPETGRLLRTLEGHSEPVRCLAFSPDGMRLATGSADVSARLWDVEAGRELLTLTGHTETVAAIAFSPDGRRVATSSNDRTARLWDAETGHEIRTFEGHTMFVQGVAFSPDGKRLATAGDERVVKIWDIETGNELRTLRGHWEGLQSLAVSPDGKRLATAGGLDLTVKIWDLDEARGARVLANHTNNVVSLAFSAEGKSLATAGYDGTVRLWDTQTGYELATLTEPGAVSSVAFTPNGRRVVAGCNSGVAKVWDVESGLPVRTFKAHSHSVTSVAVSPDGRHLATASGARFSPMGGEEDIKIWDFETGRRVQTLRGHTGPVYCLAFSPGGNRLATGSGDFTVKIWDTAAGNEIRTIPGGVGLVYSAAFSPDGRRLAAGGRNGVGRVWHVETGRELAVLRGAGGLVYSIAFSPDGKRLATGSWDNTARIWDARTGREIMALKGHTGPVACVAFAPGDTRLLATAAVYWDYSAIIWDAHPWQVSDLPGDSTQSYDERVRIVKWNQHASRRKAMKEASAFAERGRARQRRALEKCAANLQRIHAALVQHRSRHDGRMPDWLSDLLPEALSTATLRCPYDPDGFSSFYPDPKTPCSYTYEFSAFFLISRGMTCREWKNRQRKEFGGRVPTARCYHHGDRILNLSYDGRLYWSGGVWEDRQWEDYSTTATGAVDMGNPRSRRYLDARATSGTANRAGQ